MPKLSNKQRAKRNAPSDAAVAALHAAETAYKAAESVYLNAPSDAAVAALHAAEQRIIALSDGVDANPPSNPDNLPAIIPGESARDTSDKPAATAPYKSATRDAATNLAGAYPFGSESNRDSAYLQFFGYVARAFGHTATLAQIHTAGHPVPGKPHLRRNPFYSGSSKATDSGAIQRAVDSGYFILSDSGNRITATPRAIASKHYNAAPVYQPD
jgi:hypothetical protein